MTIHLGAISNQQPFVFEELEKQGFVIHKVFHGKSWRDWVRDLAPHAAAIRGLQQPSWLRSMLPRWPAVICSPNAIGAFV